jgi:hypothetical protein
MYPSTVAAVFARDGDVAAIVESLFQTFAQFVFAGWLPDAPLQIFVLEARDDFEFFHVHGAVCGVGLHASTSSGFRAHPELHQAGGSVHGLHRFIQHA